MQASERTPMAVLWHHDALEHDPEKWEPVFGKKIMLKQKAGP
jgi:hypothetical protein